MPRTITLRLPWFPRELSPNSRPHHMEKAKAVKAYRSDCYLDARDSTWPIKNPPLIRSPVLATTTFHVDAKRRYDFRNLDAALKPMWDGLVDAGILQDDSTEHLRHAESKLVLGKEKKIVVVLEEVEG